MKQPQQRPWHFWQIVGLALAVALGLTLLYVIVGPGFSIRAWSDALCVSGMLLGIGSIAPLLLDVGRGIALPGKMGSDDSRKEAMHEEHRKREKGMGVTFALAFAALLIGIASIVVSLW